MLNHLSLSLAAMVSEEKIIPDNVVISSTSQLSPYVSTEGAHTP